MFVLMAILPDCFCHGSGGLLGDEHVAGELQVLRVLRHETEILPVLGVEPAERDVFDFVEIVVAKYMVRLKRTNNVSSGTYVLALQYIYLLIRNNL